MPHFVSRAALAAAVAIALVAAQIGSADAFESATVTGVVADASGKPINNVCVTAGTATCVTYTNSRGEYTISGIPVAGSTFTFGFVKRNYQTAYTSVLVDSTTETANATLVRTR